MIEDGGEQPGALEDRRGGKGWYVIAGVDVGWHE